MRYILASVVIVPWQSRESILNSGQEGNIFLDPRHGFGAYCLYCGDQLKKGLKNREHVPSKTLLDKDIPYPPNLPTVPACKECNSGFSKDEEFVSALIECWRCGTANPEGIERQAIARALRRSPGMRVSIEQVLESEAGVFGNGRFWNVVDKLVRAHVYFELNRSPVKVAPSANRVDRLSQVEADFFENPPVSEFAPYPEIGSRAFIEVAMFAGSPWWELQEGRYRYMVTDGEPCEVRIVLSEFVVVFARCWLDGYDLEDFDVLDEQPYDVASRGRSAASAVQITPVLEPASMTVPGIAALMKRRKKAQSSPTISA